MKMSDTFKLPLASIDYQNNIVDGNGLNVLFADSHEYEKKALCEAINNHDRLESENARLREFVKKVAELDIEIFRFETQDGDYDFIEYICTDILDDANELLEELEKTNG